MYNFVILFIISLLLVLLFIYYYYYLFYLLFLLSLLFIFFVLFCFVLFCFGLRFGGFWIPEDIIFSFGRTFGPHSWNLFKQLEPFIIEIYKFLWLYY